MENDNKTCTKKKNGVSTITSLGKDIQTWPDHLTTIDLSKRNFNSIDENVKFPPNIANLNLSHNLFVEVPSAVRNLDTLKCLDLSFNKIRYFDDTPKFSHCIERLDISNNELLGPPYWVWSESSTTLAQLDLSNNRHITVALEESYFKELLRYTTLVTDVKIHNCRLRKHVELLKTFPKLKALQFGTPDMTLSMSNHLEHIPCQGLDQCCDIERLILANNQVYNIDSNIDIFKNLIELNLTQNHLTSLPKEFCHLENLEICVLSSNNILYLPDDMAKLKKLVCLRLDFNNLCMLPDNLNELENLKVLDVYDNSLHEVPEGIFNIEELDLAQNYLEEPSDQEYAEKKQKLRLNIDNRQDGRKEEVCRSESIHSTSTTDDEELIHYMDNISQEHPATDNQPPSSPEDWDSDDYWIPCYYGSNTAPPQQSWLYFVKRKMDEGNFCPMDMHAVPVAEKVKYEKMCNPTVWREVYGQFDDCSDDDS